MLIIQKIRPTSRRRRQPRMLCVPWFQLGHVVTHNTTIVFSVSWTAEFIYNASRPWDDYWEAASFRKMLDKLHNFMYLVLSTNVMGRLLSACFFRRTWPPSIQSLYFFHMHSTINIACTKYSTNIIRMLIFFQLLCHCIYNQIKWEQNLMSE